MLDWLRKIRPKAEVTPPPFWGTPYVTAFSDELDTISHGLSAELDDLVFCDIEQESERAVFKKSFGGEEVARLRVEGEYCAPTNVIVESSLPETTRTIFIEAFQLPVRFEPLPV